MDVKIEKSWKAALTEEFEKSYFEELTKVVKEAYLKGVVYPPPRLVFNAFDLCLFDHVKVVILGQDPYHGQGQAHGLCFSVQNGVPTPPSLKNIYKEIKNDLGFPIPESGNLEKWAKQGVLLLNATLTVLPGKAGRHQGLGWETFTDMVIQKLSTEKENLVFLLWGRYAQDKGNIIDTSKHLILTSSHPSPFSAHNGFLGSHHFSTTNTYLKEKGKKEIDWKI